MFIAMPLTVPLFLIGVFRIEYLFTKHWPYMIGFFALMGGLSVLISRTTYRNQLPKYEWVIILTNSSLYFIGIINCGMHHHSLLALGYGKYSIRHGLCC